MELMTAAGGPNCRHVGLHLDQKSAVSVTLNARGALT
jgi:hypothetical protein